MNTDPDERLRAEWRTLGFFYTLDDVAQAWHLVGSRADLLRFRDALLRYAADPRNVVQSEHEHYGPYHYLKVMTWPVAGMDGDAIYGSLDALHRLAGIIEARLAAARPGTVVRIREEFAPASPYSLLLHVQPDAFDPAAADSGLATSRGESSGRGGE